MKKLLKDVEITEDCKLFAFDAVALYPSIPIKKTSEMVREELETDETLSLRTKWNVNDIMEWLEIAMITYFKTLDGKIY